MSDPKLPSTFRLILVPTLITLALNITRLVMECRGAVTSQSGGGAALLGISWLMFVFGGWFGLRLSRNGSAPRLRPAPLWQSLPLLVVVGVAMWQFGGIDQADQSDAAYAALRSAVTIIVAAAIVAALFSFAVWSRLAWTLLCYAIPARLTVVAMTFLAKWSGWDTHYTKFGPSGIERDLGETMVSTCVAQLGFWVPLTIVAGGLVGCTTASVIGRRAAR